MPIDTVVVPRIPGSEFLTLEEVYLLTEVPQDMSPKLKTQQAKQLHAVGLTKKALRYDQCRHWRTVQCSDNHTAKEWFKCFTKMCQDCAHLLMRDTLERWAIRSKWMIQTADADDQLVFIDVLLPPHERTRADAERAFDLIEDHFYSNQPGPTWMNVPAFEGRSVRIRALMITKSTRTAAEWRSLLPGTVEAYVGPVDRLLTFQAMLLAPDLPKSFEDRAEQEKIFDRFHNVRTSRMTRGQLPAAPESIFVSQQPEDTEIPPEPPPTRLYASIKCCHICGQAYVRASDWFGDKDKPTRLADIKWHPI